MNSILRSRWSLVLAFAAAIAASGFLRGSDGPSASATAPLQAAARSWTAERVHDGHTPTVGNRAVALDAAGFPHVAYGSDHLYYARRDAGGWHREIADPLPGVGTGASLVLGAGDKAHVAYFDAENSRLLHATNASGAWVSDVVFKGVSVGYAAYSGIGLDSAGHVHIAFLADDGRLLHATNSGGPWTVATVAGDGVAGLYCSLAVDSHDHVHVAYVGRAAGRADELNFDLRYATDVSGSWRTELVAKPAGTTQSVGIDCCIALDSAGHAHISYQDYINHVSSTKSVLSELRLAYATNATGRWKSQDITATGFAGSGSSIAIGPSGAVHISYQDGNDNVNPKLAYATDASGAFATKLVEPGGAGTSIAVSAAGVVHMVHGVYGGLDGIRHASGTFAGVTQEQVDDADPAGGVTSMRLTPAGEPRIAFFAGHEVRFAARSGAVWSTATIDATPTYAGGVAMALDAAGHAHVAYYDHSVSFDERARYATNATGSWVAETIDQGSGTQSLIGLVVDKSSVPHVLFLRNASDGQSTVNYATRTGAGWTVVPIVSGSDAFIAAPSLAIDASDHAHAALILYNSADSTYRLVHGTNASGAWVFTTILPVVEYGSPSIAVDGAGAVHVAWSVQFSDTLRHATNASGAWTTEFVAFGSDPDIRADDLGGVHMAYLTPDGALGYSTDASGRWESFVVDTGAGGARQFTSVAYAAVENDGGAVISVAPSGRFHVGSGVSLALDAARAPRFSYLDTLLADLKYAAPGEAVAPSVTVDFAASPDTAAAGARFTPVQGTLGWAVGDTGTKSFVVPLVDGTTVEPPETVTLTLSNPSPGTILGDPSSATLTILDDDLPAGTVLAQFLPKKVIVKPNAKAPDKSKLTVTGYFDTGPSVPKLNASVTLTIGGLTIRVPPPQRLRGSKLVYSTKGLSLTVVPGRSGSSRGAFKLTYTGKSAGSLDVSAPMTLRFQDNGIDAAGRVQLTNGAYTLGRKRGELFDPVLFLYAAKATLPGGGKDGLKLSAGLGSVGAAPAVPPDVTVSFGPKYSVTIPGSSFQKDAKGTKFTAKGGAPGVKSVVLDYAKERFTFVAAGVDLGTFGTGPQPVLVTLTAGSTRAVFVRFGRSGSSLLY